MVQVYDAADRRHWRWGKLEWRRPVQFSCQFSQIFGKCLKTLIKMTTSLLPAEGCTWLEAQFVASVQRKDHLSS
jgi:hypothetical protein